MVYKPDCTHAFHELNRLNFIARVYLASKSSLEEFKESVEEIDSNRYISDILKYLDDNNSELAKMEKSLRDRIASEYEPFQYPENFEENLRDIFGKITKLSEGKLPEAVKISYNDLLNLQKIIQPVYDDIYKNPDYCSTFL